MNAISAARNIAMKRPARGPLMMLRRVLITTVLLLGMGVAAHAATLATGSVYGGETQVFTTCAIFNAGTTSITFVSEEIIRSDGDIVPLFTNNCSTLRPGDTCVIGANTSAIHGHACRVRFNGLSTFIRGVMDIRRGNTVLNSSELR